MTKAEAIMKVKELSAIIDAFDRWKDATMAATEWPSDHGKAHWLGMADGFCSAVWSTFFSLRGFYKVAYDIQDSDLEEPSIGEKINGE